MKTFLKILSKILIVLVIVAVVVRIVLVMSGENEEVIMKDSIAVVRLEGVIVDTRDMDKKLKKLDENEKVKGVIIEINSPGGAVAPTQMLYNRIMKMKKPVYSVMETVAASGGYYTAAATDKIYAMDSTITGSIGVIMQYSNVAGLLEKVGIKSMVFKSGKMKGVPSPTEELTSEQKEYLQGTINDFYEQFIGDVLKRRNIAEQKLRQLADGRIYTGRQAMEQLLVDRIGSREEAVIDMKNEIGIQELDVKELYEPEEPLFAKFFGRAKSVVSEYVPEGGFYYLYKPAM